MTIPSPGETDQKRIVDSIRSLYQGGSNNTGQVKLNAGATTTVVNHPSAGPNSHISLTPITAHASAAVAAGMYISTRSLGTFTITHASSANADQTFTYEITGGA